MHWFSMTFTHKYRIKYQTIGKGHIFQDRYKSFHIKDERYFLKLMIYIEKNALAARLVKKPEEWRWSSLWIKKFGNLAQKELINEWPIDVPKNYLNLLN